MQIGAFFYGRVGGDAALGSRRGMRDFLRHSTVTQRDTSPPFGPVVVD